MNLRLPSVIVLAGAIALSGCATPAPTSQDLAAMNYGDPLTIDYQEVIKKRFDETVSDPATTLFKFADPVRYWYRDSPLEGGKLYVGYAVNVDVNARNSLGGEIGWRHYIFIFHNGEIVKVLTPEDLRTMTNY